MICSGRSWPSTVVIAVHDRLWPMVSPRRPANMTILALALAAGVAVGWNQPSPIVWPWLVIAAIASVAATIVRGPTRPRIVLLSLAIMLLGAGWVTLSHHY